MASINLSVSIVIPNYNGAHLLEKHLPAVIAAAPNVREIIVVDDASTDNSVHLIKNKFPQIKIHALHSNQRFAVACNAGVQSSTSDVIILLNNDVSPHKDFLLPLLAPFTDPQVFAVGCLELSIDHGQTQESGRSQMSFQRGLVIHSACPDQYQTTTSWVSGGSGAFRKSIWQELNGMDPLFKPAYEEDRDLCYRALKRGYRISFAPTSRVIHQHETTNAKALGKKIMRLSSYKNHLLFVWKNITDPKLFFLHLIFLPYHLLLTSIKSKGEFFLAFLWALTQIPRIIPRRLHEINKQKVKDYELL